jgi:hypothetical protein
MVDLYPLPDLIRTTQRPAAAVVLMAGHGVLQAIPRHNQASIEMSRKTHAEPARIEVKVGGIGTIDRIADNDQGPLLTLGDFRGGEQHTAHRDLPTLEVAAQGIPGGNVRVDAADLARLERRSPAWRYLPSEHALHHLCHEGNHLLVYRGLSTSPGWQDQRNHRGPASQHVERTIDAIPMRRRLSQQHPALTGRDGGVEGQLRVENG